MFVVCAYVHIFIYPVLIYPDYIFIYYSTGWFKNRKFNISMTLNECVQLTKNVTGQD